MDFTGRGVPLTQAGMDRAAEGVGRLPLFCVLAVETSGCGYLPDRRPKILFERHVFHRLTGGRYDALSPDISAPTAGGYGDAGAPQYARLRAALALDADAALESASWGLGQIMGENHRAAGFADAPSMVAAFVASEDAQLAGMVAFLTASGMATALRDCDWPRFARLYNGPDYAANRYPERLAQAFALYGQRGPPDLNLRAAQVELMYRGLYSGAIDGLCGPATTTAIEAFQRAAHLPVTGKLDDALLAALSVAGT